jgi:hypothetical protein
VMFLNAIFDGIFSVRYRVRVFMSIRGLQESAL